MIRVAVADDQQLVRSGFSVLLRSTPDIDVVGEAANGAEAIDLALQTLPDVVLMDIRMPLVDGLEATRRLTADPRAADVRVLILTTFDLDEYVFEALRAGASGFLLKDTRPDDLLDAVRVVAAGEALLSPAITRTLIAEFVKAQPSVPASNRRVTESLTQRELEVLAAVARGLSNAELAAELYMSHATAKTHVSHLLAKLQARDRAQLVVVAYEAGVVAPGAGTALHPAG